MYTLLLLASIVGTALSQNKVHTVIVGPSGQMAFSPSELTASVGDQVEFVFANTSHTVVQGIFENPCNPIDTEGNDGFYSGIYMDTQKNDSWTITIRTSEPIWFYDGINSNCQEGMVGVINAPAGQTQQHFADAASQVRSNGNYSPNNAQGGVWNRAFGPPPTSTSTSSTASTTSTSTVRTTTTEGAAAAIMTPFAGVGVGAVVGMVAGLAWI